MKIIRNGICYIEKDDILAIDELNDCVLEEINWKESYSSFLKYQSLKTRNQFLSFKESNLFLIMMQLKIYSWMS